MSLDSTLRAIAYAESRTHGAAIAQIAKRRVDLDAALRAETLHDVPVTSKDAALERALATVETAHRLDISA